MMNVTIRLCFILNARNVNRNKHLNHRRDNTGYAQSFRIYLYLYKHQLPLTLTLTIIKPFTEMLSSVINLHTTYSKICFFLLKLLIISLYYIFVFIYATKTKCIV